MEHTKEPWADDGFGQVGANGSDQFNGGYFTAICGGPEKNANAIRIAACVNACSGISTENLESNLPVKELAIRYNDCIKQRDELLDALIEAKGWNWFDEENIPCVVVEKINAAIAKAQSK